jgi:hypothetical protein
VQVEVEEVEAREGELGVDVRERHAEDGEGRGDEEQSERLGPLRQPEVALLADLDPVVERADDPRADDEREHEETGTGEEEPAPHVRDDVADHRRDDDAEPAHRGLARLDLVPLGHVLVDGLTDAVPLQPVDEVTGREE